MNLFALDHDTTLEYPYDHIRRQKCHCFGVKKEFSMPAVITASKDSNLILISICTPDNIYDGGAWVIFNKYEFGTYRFRQPTLQ